MIRKRMMNLMKRSESNDHRQSPWNNRISPPVGELGDTATRVLLAAMSLRRPTVRSIARECGWSLQVVHDHLKKLRAAGLVAWEDGCHGTMRVQVKPVSFAAK